MKILKMVTNPIRKQIKNNYKNYLQHILLYPHAKKMALKIHEHLFPQDFKKKYIFEKKSFRPYKP